MKRFGGAPSALKLHVLLPGLVLLAFDRGGEGQPMTGGMAYAGLAKEADILSEGSCVSLLQRGLRVPADDVVLKGMKAGLAPSASKVLEEVTMEEASVLEALREVDLIEKTRLEDKVLQRAFQQREDEASQDEQNAVLENVANAVHSLAGRQKWAKPALGELQAAELSPPGRLQQLPMQLQPHLLQESQMQMQPQVLQASTFALSAMADLLQQPSPLQ